MTKYIASIICRSARNLVTEDSLQKTCEKDSIHCQLPGHISEQARSVQLPDPEMVISGMYESPIAIVLRRMSQKIEDDIMKAVQEVCVEVGVSVDKEELIKALQYDRDQYEKGYLDGKFHRAQENEWISVEERPPDPNEDCLVAAKVGDRTVVDLGERVESFNIRTGEHYCEWMIANDWDEGEGCEITHWMPIPEPPKGE